MNAFWESFKIVVVATVFALAAFAMRPGLLPWELSKGEISVSQALALPNALWVDARIAEDYDTGTYPGAILVNEESWEEGFVGLLDRWDAESPIVVFCSSQACLRSHHVAERLREELGVEAVFSLTGGWESLRLETEKGKAP